MLRSISKSKHATERGTVGSVIGNWFILHNYNEKTKYSISPDFHFVVHGCLQNIFLGSLIWI